MPSALSKAGGQTQTPVTPPVEAPAVPRPPRSRTRRPPTREGPHCGTPPAPRGQLPQRQPAALLPLRFAVAPPTDSPRPGFCRAAETPQPRAGKAGPEGRTHRGPGTATVTVTVTDPPHRPPPVPAAPPATGLPSRDGRGAGRRLPPRPMGARLRAVLPPPANRARAWPWRASVCTGWRGSGLASGRWAPREPRPGGRGPARQRRWGAGERDSARRGRLGRVRCHREARPQVGAAAHPRGGGL